MVVTSTIKIYGLPRSCTNVVAWVLRNAFDCQVWTNYPDWKHGSRAHTGGLVVGPDGRKSGPLRYVVCLKHPCRWIESLYRHETTAWRRTVDFERFLDSPSHYYRNQGWSPVESFNRLVPEWLAMDVPPGYLTVVRHEDLCGAPERTAAALQEALGLERTTDVVTLPEHEIRPGYRLGTTAFTFRRDGLSPEQVEQVEKRLDRRAVRLAGYELIAVTNPSSLWEIHKDDQRSDVTLETD